MKKLTTNKKIIIALCIFVFAIFFISQVRHYIHDRFFSLDDLRGMNENQLKLSAEYNKPESIQKFEKSIYGAWKLEDSDPKTDSKILIRPDHTIDMFEGGVFEESYEWELFADVGDNNKPIYKFTYTELDSTETIEVKGDSLFFTDTDTENKPFTLRYKKIVDKK